MRASIIKAFLPWITFSAFANGTMAGLQIGSAAAIITLLLFNRGALKKKFLLDWVTLIFFVVLPVIGGGIPHSLVIQYGLLLSTLTASLVCFISLIIPRITPITLPYAQMSVPHSYWSNPILINTNRHITLVWGLVFLLSSISIACFHYQIGEQLWMIQIIPTALLIVAIAFTLIFPDLHYKHTISKASGIFDLSASLSSLQHLQTDDMEITYKIMGHGAPLILAQDAYLNMHAWDPDFLKQLATDFQLILFDYPNINQPDITTLSRTISCLIDHLKITPPTLLGFGLGGFVAQTFAILHPNQIKGLILINTDTGGETAIQSQSNREKLSQLFSKSLTEKCEMLLPLWFPNQTSERFNEKIKQILLADELTTNQTASHYLDEIPSLFTEWYQQTPADLNKLKQHVLPTLIITGQQDELIPAANVQSFEQQLKNPILVNYDDAGHGIIYQYPYDIADQIKMFLSALYS